MDPDFPDLDDLLNSIQDEGKRERALALYEGTREDDLVEEEIDERILRLLGLEDTFDIDYDTYKTLLKEANIRYSVLGTKDIPTEEVMLLQDELKRVRRKVGRFKLKKKKITADDLGGISGAIRKEDKQQYYLVSKAIIPEAEVSGEESKEKTDRLLENVITIRETVESILDSLKDQVRLEKETAELERKRDQIARRNKRESELEKKKQKKGGALGSIAKVFSPIRGVLNSIFRFLAYSILGRAFRSFIDWFSDEKNKKKVDTIVRFLKDWWPAILGALFLFTNPFGRFIRAFIGTVLKLTFRLTKFAIPKLLSFMKKNPALLAAGVGAGLFAAGAVVPKLFPETVDAEERKTQAAPGSKEEKIEALKKQKENLGFLEKLQGVGSEIDEQINKLETGQTKSYGFSGGGSVPENKISAKDIRFDGGGVINSGSGLKISGAGSDTQLVAATPGEIVISKPAVDTFGADTFLGMNEIGGGTNKPSTINNIQFAAGGGMIGKKKISTKPNKFKLPFFNMQSLRKNKVENREKPPVGMTSRSYNNVSVGNVGNRYTNNYKMISQNIMKSNSYPVNYSPNQNYSQLQLTSGSRVNMMIPGPLPSGSSSSFIPLPDIVQSLPPKQMGVNDGTKIPEFIGSPFSDKASINAGIYGIV